MRRSNLWAFGSISLGLHLILLGSMFWPLAEPTPEMALDTAVDVDYVERSDLVSSPQKVKAVASQPPPAKVVAAKKTVAPGVTSTNRVSSETSSQELNYVSELRQYLKRHTIYPRSARRLRHAGEVVLKLRISASGRFEAVHVVSASPFSDLNQAAESLLASLGKFKPLPIDLGSEREFIVPIEYRLSGGTL